jgi:hypothetical protein
MQDCAGIEVVIEASWRERIERRYVTAATTKSTASRPSKVVSVIFSRALSMQDEKRRTRFGSPKPGFNPRSSVSLTPGFGPRRSVPLTPGFSRGWEACALPNTVVYDGSRCSFCILNSEF